jgi:hypothetical protein
MHAGAKQVQLSHSQTHLFFATPPPQLPSTYERFEFAAFQSSLSIAFLPKSYHLHQRPRNWPPTAERSER